MSKVKLTPRLRRLRDRARKLDQEGRRADDPAVQDLLTKYMKLTTSELRFMLEHEFKAQGNRLKRRD